MMRKIIQKFSIWFFRKSFNLKNNKNSKGEMNYGKI